MHSNGDLYVMIIILVMMALWLAKRFVYWLQNPMRRRSPLPDNGALLTGEAVDLLVEAGYEVVSGKHRVPIRIMLDNFDKPLESRYYIDYLARSDGQLYIVKIAKDRQPMEWTGSALRDRLLPYQLLFEQTEGILYIDMSMRTIRKIKFEVEY